MTIALITDGMLYPIIISPTPPHTPEGGEGSIYPRPAPPCKTKGIVIAQTPPQIPRRPRGRST